MNTGVGEIGNELNVQAVLNGRVTTRNDQVSLSLELVDVATENIIWSQKYDRTQKDLIALQNEIARDVLTRIRSTLTGNSSKAGSEIRTEDPEAYTAYLKGLYHFNKRERNDYLKALEYFRKAVQLDPDYALAYVGISSATALAEREDIHTDTRRKEAFEALERAKSLAPDSSEVHAGLANHYFFWKMEWEKAEPEYREAISLNPNYSTAHHWYGEALCYLGRFEECFPHFQRALEIDPLSLAIISDLGRAYYFAGRYDDARKQLEKGIDLDPDFSRSYEYLSMVYEASGEYEKAAEQIEKRESREYEAAAAEQKKTELVQALRASGPKGYWQKRLEWKLKEDRARNNSSYWQLADIFAKLGEKDKAFEQLELALEYKWYVAPTLWVDPALDPLRSDPRFEALLTKTGLFKSAQNKRK
jgi:tetratricopeptide (TPR) repeat protein